MKKDLHICSLFLLLLCVCSINVQTINAQPRHSSRYHDHDHGHHDPYHGRSSHYSSSPFHDAAVVIDAVATTAMLGAFFHQLDDYTGIRIGYNAASLRCSGFGNANLNSDFTSGFNCGLVFGWYLGKSPVIIEPGLFYSMKGGELRSRDVYYDGTLKSTLHMIEVPLVFKYDLNPGIKVPGAFGIQPFFGGFLAWGCGGTTKTSWNNDSYSAFGSGTGQLDYFDAGLRTGCGLAIDHFYLEFVYDLGLVNLANDYFDYFHYDSFSDAVHSNCISINMGVNF